MKTTKVWTIKMQTSTTTFKTIRVKATNQVIAWRKAIAEEPKGMVIAIHLTPKTV